MPERKQGSGAGKTCARQLRLATCEAMQSSVLKAKEGTQF